MGFFDWLGAAATAIIPGAAPIVAATRILAPTLFTGGAPVPQAPITTGSDVSSLGTVRVEPAPPDYSSLGTPASPIFSDTRGIPFDETPALGGGPFSDLPVPPIGGDTGLSMMAPIGTAVAAIRGALPEIAAVVPRWILRTAGYAALAAAIYEEYRRLRAMGHRHKTARRHALMRHGVHLRRRRMRVTNVHALRRAIRRVHGFRRICSKVGALHVGRRRLLPMRHYRRHYRRGDVDPFLVEELAEMADEAEDMGYEPDQFREVYE